MLALLLWFDHGQAVISATSGFMQNQRTLFIRKSFDFSLSRKFVTFSILLILNILRPRLVYHTERPHSRNGRDSRHSAGPSAAQWRSKDSRRPAAEAVKRPSLLPIFQWAHTGLESKMLLAVESLMPKQVGNPIAKKCVCDGLINYGLFIKLQHTDLCAR